MGSGGGVPSAVARMARMREAARVVRAAARGLMLIVLPPRWMVLGTRGLGAPAALAAVNSTDSAGEAPAGGNMHGEGMPAAVVRGGFSMPGGLQLGAGHGEGNGTLAATGEVRGRRGGGRSVSAVSAENAVTGVPSATPAAAAG